MTGLEQIIIVDVIFFLVIVPLVLWHLSEQKEKRETKLRQERRRNHNGRFFDDPS